MKSKTTLMTIAMLVLFACKREDTTMLPVLPTGSISSVQLSEQLQAELPAIVLATYNVRTDVASDGPGNAWSSRKSLIANMVTTYKFDVFGTQEVKDNQLTDLKALLPAYSHVGTGRNSNGTGEHTGIFYNKSKFKLLSSGNFWLSTTPNVPGSISWGAGYPRVCTWAKIEDIASGAFFFYFNTHVDNVSLAQTNSVSLLLSKVDEIAGTSPVVLSADFNFDQFSSKYNTLNNSGKFKDAYALNHYPYDPKGHTYNDFDVNRVSDKRIDHIFVSPHFQVDQYSIPIDTYNGKLPSDHYPVRIILNAASKPDQPSTVTIPFNQQINIKGNNNLFVSSNNGSSFMTCDRPTAGSWETFLVTDAGSGKVTLKAMNKFTSSENGATAMTCDRTTAGGWEKFDWIPNADGTFSLRGNNGRYVSSGNGADDMSCKSVEVRGWEKFSFQ